MGTFKNHVSAPHNSNDKSVESVGVRGNENPDSDDEDSDSDNPDFDVVDGRASDTNNVDDVTDIDQVGVEASNIDSLDCSKELLQKSSAIFLLGLKEKYPSFHTRNY